jgi:hypothetical protein
LQLHLHLIPTRALCFRSSSSTYTRHAAPCGKSSTRIISRPRPHSLTTTTNILLSYSLSLFFVFLGIIIISLFVARYASTLPIFKPFQLLTYLSTDTRRRPQNARKMCYYTRNYYIYSGCTDPGAHFFGTSVDGKAEQRCPRGPHERYIVVPGHCPLCS